MTWTWIQSFCKIFKFLILYHQMMFRLMWRGKLPPDFARVMAVQGQTRRNEARCLYDLAHGALKDGVIVEIGSYRGLSTIALARGSLQGPKIPVYAIDPHECTHGHRQGEEYGPQDNIAFFEHVLFFRAAGIIRPINLLSIEAVAGWKKRVSLLQIDGNHDYEAVRADFSLWSPFVLPGGRVAFHDSSEPESGPFRVVQEALKEGKYIFQKRVNKVPVLEKQGSPIALEARARNLPTEAIEVCT